MTRTAEIEFEMATTYDPTTHPHDYLFQHPDHREQDEARLKAWLNDEWYFLAVRAKATIKIPHGTNPQCWITSELLSPGLWGIASDSDDAYLQEVYHEEREILTKLLSSLKTYNVVTA
jgi:hypothetical protein